MERNHKTEQGKKGWERGIKFERERQMNDRSLKRKAEIGTGTGTRD